MAVDNFEQDLIVHEEQAELVGVYVVDDQLVEELQNKNAALVNLLPISCRNLGVNCVPRVLALQLLIFHLSVCCCCISLLCCKTVLASSFGKVLRAALSSAVHVTKVSLPLCIPLRCCKAEQTPRLGLVLRPASSC